MVEEGDVIGVAISGGKDSLVMAKLFQELQKYSKVKFELVFMAMNPGFNKENEERLIQNCQHLNIDLKLFTTEIFDILNKIAKDNPCFMCAKMRRGALYNFAEEMGCNKLALGHHFDDMIETTMLNILYAGEFKTMLPKLKSDNYKNLTLIRPMVNIREKDIIN